MEAAPLVCPLVSWADDADWPAIERAFSRSPVLELGQAWRAEPEPDLQPARAMIGWQPGFFCVFAVLRDLDIFNDARGLNEHTWQLGDVLEIFLGHEEGGEYFEFHVTPDNQLLQLRFPHWRIIEEITEAAQVARFHLTEKVVDSRVWVDPERQRWTVLARIPFSTLSLAENPLAVRLLFSICRYDYTRGKERPVESSTSLHPAGNFHEQKEWRRAVMVE